MGNSSSVSLEYAEWEDRTKCSHSYCDIRVDEVRWIRVPMATEAARVSTEVAKGIFLGPFGGAVVKDLSHECLEFLTTCTKCGAGRRFTAEINSSGQGKAKKNFTCGFYSKEYDARHTYKPGNMTLQYVHDKYLEMDESYNLITNNCGHWSNRLWDKL